MTMFQVIQAVIDVREYAELVWFMLRSCQNKEDFEKLLRSELPEEGRQCILNAAQNGYPLSLELRLIDELEQWKKRFMEDREFRERVENFAKRVDQHENT